MRTAKLMLAALVTLAIAAVGFIYLAPATAMRWATDAERNRANLVRKEITADGLHYAYLEGGQGEPLLLLHGFGANKDAFAQVAGFLTAQYRVIIPDLVGFGESDHPMDADYAPAAQAARVHALAQALGLKAFHLGGSSMGGHIALTYAANYPSEVKSLWLLDSGGVWSASQSELARVASGQTTVFVKSTDDLANALTFYMSKPPYVPRPLLNVLAQERIQNYALEQRIFQAISADSVEARAATVAAPTLIVWGAQDRALNVATAGVLHQLLARSQVIIMPEVGHLPMLEQPQQTAEDYLRFRAGLGAAGLPTPPAVEMPHKGM